MLSFRATAGRREIFRKIFNLMIECPYKPILFLSSPLFQFLFSFDSLVYVRILFIIYKFATVILLSETRNESAFMFLYSSFNVICYANI